MKELPIYRPSRSIFSRFLHKIAISAIKCELRALRPDAQQKHGGESGEDVDQETPKGADLAGALDAGLLLNPVEQRFDRLTKPQDRSGVEPVGGIQARLAFLFFDGGQDRERQVGIPGEIFVAWSA